MNDVLITNRYDALGRRIARKVDGVETRYVLDLSGGMERILCDTTASGQITAYYIHGLDLCYRVDASNNVICYHADAQANIIAVTDGGGTNMAQYAYTPYGRSLGSTNSQPSTLNSQPFLFVGSQGVMEELPGLYFMRARYYSADAGVFLSTDPMKKIGPGWRPVAHGYGNQNPLIAADPKGETPLHLLAFVAGLEMGLVEGVFEGAIESHLSKLPVAFGVPESAADDVTAASFELYSAGQTALKTYRYAKTVISAGDPSRLVAANTLGEVVGGKIGNGVYSLSGKILDGYVAGLNKIGSAIGGVLYNNFGVGAPPNNSMPNRTVASSTQPSILNPVQATPRSSPAGNSGNTTGGGTGGSTGGTTSGSGGSITYTVRSGDTLGNIGFANGTTARAIGAANGIQNLNLIRPGQVLTTPRR